MPNETYNAFFCGAASIETNRIGDGGGGVVVEAIGNARATHSGCDLCTTSGR